MHKAADEIIEDQKEYQRKHMKIYVLKWKDDVVKIALTQYDIMADYRWERKELRKDMTVHYGTYTEEGTIEVTNEPSKGDEVVSD